ncbi:MAG: hypothetical protein D6778_08740 [Nitrospirae bacterium]|nr:MAG: hypothetical protein D6778_08740 [Nitrospirota bacterium]
MFWRLITSVKTVVGLGVVLLGLLLWGGFIMPASEEFSTINSVGLFQWLRDASFWAGWWLWGAVLVVGLMVLSALACIFESLKKLRSWKSTALRVSVELMHLGFCLIMFGHFLDAKGAYHRFYLLMEGAKLRYPDGHTLSYEGLDYFFTETIIGKIEAKFLSQEGETITIGPNRPYLYRGTGLYLKQFRGPQVMVELSYEPGALWALAGGLLFMAGSVMVFVFRLREKTVQ